MTTTESAPTEVAARLADRFDEDGLPYAFGGALALPPAPGSCLLP
jgi:hypothetical protein